MSRNKVVVEEGVVRVVTVGIQGPPGVGISQQYVDDGDAASRQRSNHTGTQPASTISDFATAVDGRVAIQKGVANGLATLGSDNKIPSAQLPAIAITDTFPVASQAAMLALTAEVGDVAVRTDLNKSFILKTAGASTLSNWQELLTPTDAVLSVNGQTGAVSLTASGLGALVAANNLSDVANAATARTNLGLAIGTNVQAYSAELAGLTALSPSNDDVIQRKAGAWASRSMAQIKSDLALSKSDVGLGIVDNTSDLSKPISTATQSALDLKAPLASPALTGTPTAPTAAAGTNTTQIATTAFVGTAIGNLINGAPGALDTLNELATALGNDANFATTIANALANKQPLDATLTALAAYNSNGLLVQTAADTFTGRSIAADSAKISVTNGNGVSGNPTIDLGSVASTDLSNSANIALLSGAQTFTGPKTFNAGALLDKGNQVFNVKAAGFGAVGDGVTDDTAAILAAITAAVSAGGGAIFFPDGTYNITSPFNLNNKPNLRFFCAAPGSATIQIPQASLASFGNAFMFYGQTSSTDVVFENLRLYGRYSLYTSPPNAQGGGLSPGVRWTIKNCLIEDFNYFGLYIAVQSVDCQVIYNRFKGPGRGPDHIGGGGGDGIEIAFNVFESDLLGNAIDQTGGTNYNIHDNINRCANSFYLEGLTQTKVNNNWMLNGGGIIAESDSGYFPTVVTNSYDIEVSGNHLYGGGSITMTITMDPTRTSTLGGNFRVNHNTIDSPDTYGILFHAGHGSGSDIS